MATLDGYTVHDVLRQAGVPLRASAQFGDGIGAALWDRDVAGDTRYDDPGHHTLSLYLDGGTGISRRRDLDAPWNGGPDHRGPGQDGPGQDGPGQGGPGHGGPGRLCIMPAGVTTDWAVAGPVRMFHLYIPRNAFDRAVVEALDADPAAVRLRDETYVRDQTIETVIRSVLLPLRWGEPADRIAASHAGRMLIAYLASRFSERTARALQARGGLPPAVLRRVAEFVEAHLEAPLSIDELAAVAGLSPFHFARAFKQSAGEAPHRFVLHRRIERAKTLIAADGLPLAEVAAACGFSSQSHFTLRFREVTGLTPKRFADARA